MQNPNCQGSGPCTPGQVRLLPVGTIPDHGNMILCHHCFNHEIEYRRGRNFELAGVCKFKLPTWESLKVYGQEEAPV